MLCERDIPGTFSLRRAAEMKTAVSAGLLNNFSDSSSHRSDS